ncbi:MAG TPA: ankyrin repeat domain-containing protein, partial [Polyangia bacterium]
RALLDGGVDLNERRGPRAETPLHVAARRRRVRAVELLVERGADVDARTAGGKTAYVHALRRGFDDVVAALDGRGAAVALTDADRLAVALVGGRLAEARAILAANPGAARTGNGEEDRLLADLAGRPGRERVQLVVDAGADLAAPGLDGGTPLHQAAWFGQPENARLLLAAGAPLEPLDDTHGSSPLGWAVHGSRYADADERQDAYVELVELLLQAGARFGDEALRQRLRSDASERVAKVLAAAGL